MDTIKELRTERKLTQRQAAELLGISLRSYKTYETDSTKIGSFKYLYIAQKLQEMMTYDEEHGIWAIDDIKEKCEEVVKNYPVDYVILFGSYAKGTASEISDIDLLISTEIKGLKYYELVEELRVKLHKKIDALGVEQLEKNKMLINEILKDGIRIYG